jgi:predicted PolB exonuclease-like 3'-5' exonuclease
MNFNFLVLDIETVPNDLVWDRRPGQEDRERPSIFHKVVAIAVMHVTKDAVDLRSIGRTRSSEEVMLRRFQAYTKPALVQTSTPVTYAGRFFDIPVLMWRSMHYGMVMPYLYRSGRERYNTNSSIDLCDALALFGGTTRVGLKSVCQNMGLPGKTDMSGADVETAYNEGRINDIRLYNRQDVVQTGLVLMRWLLVGGEVSPPTYVEVSKRILEAATRSGIDTSDWEAGLSRGVNWR